MTARRDTAASVLDEPTRPTAPKPDALRTPSPAGKAVAEHFLNVHDGYRAEMLQVLDMLDKVRRGTEEIGAARSTLQTLAVRANDWALGGYCQAQCQSLTEHHGIEDEGIFPHLRRSQADLAPVLDRLNDEHHAIHDLLERVDDTLIQVVQHPTEYGPISQLLNVLSATILSHFSYEEQELLTPLSRFGFYAGQV